MEITPQGPLKPGKAQNLPSGPKQQKAGKETQTKAANMDAVEISSAGKLPADSEQARLSAQGLAEKIPLSPLRSAIAHQPERLEKGPALLA